MKLPRKTYSALFHLLFCSALTGWEERNPGTRIRIPTRTHACTHLTAKCRIVVSRHFRFLFIVREVRWEAFRAGKKFHLWSNSSARYKQNVFQHCSINPLSPNRIVQTYILLKSPWNFKLFSTSLQKHRAKSVLCQSKNFTG